MSLRLIEWVVEDEPITENRFLPVTTSVFPKILLQFKNLV